MLFQLGAEFISGPEKNINRSLQWRNLPTFIERYFSNQFLYEIFEILLQVLKDLNIWWLWVCVFLLDFGPVFVAVF